MKKLVFILCAIISVLVQAGSVQTGTVEVHEVLSGYSHNGIFISVSTALPNPGKCPSNSSVSTLIAAIPDRNNVDHVLTVALAAKMSKAKIDVQVYDDICFEGWPVIRRIRIK